jgi:hypothetical protein
MSASHGNGIQALIDGKVSWAMPAAFAAGNASALLLSGHQSTRRNDIMKKFNCILFFFYTRMSSKNNYAIENKHTHFDMAS